MNFEIFSSIIKFSHRIIFSQNGQIISLLANELAQNTSTWSQSLPLDGHRIGLVEIGQVKLIRAPTLRVYDSLLCVGSKLTNWSIVLTSLNLTLPFLTFQMTAWGRSWSLSVFTAAFWLAKYSSNKTSGIIVLIFLEQIGHRLRFDLWKDSAQNTVTWSHLFPRLGFRILDFEIGQIRFIKWWSTVSICDW